MSTRPPDEFTICILESVKGAVRVSQIEVPRNFNKWGKATVKSQIRKRGRNKDKSGVLYHGEWGDHPIDYKKNW